MRRRGRLDLIVSPPPDAYELTEARGYGLTASDLRRWRPLSAIEIHWARKHGLSPDAARRWAREGVGVRDAVRAIRLRIRPEQVRPWAEVGFLPGDAVEAAEAGMTLAAFETRYNAIARPFTWKFTRTDLHDLLRRIDVHDKTGPHALAA